MVSRGISRIVIFCISVFTVAIHFSSAVEPRVPSGFQIEEFASGLGTPRFMALSPDGVLFVTIMGEGSVAALPDENRDGIADKLITFVKGLKRPHGIAFHDEYLYIGETNQIVRYKYNGLKSGPGPKEVVVPNLPAGGHFTRTVTFGPDEKMYVSIGSSCNVCLEKDKRRATVMRYNPDGNGAEIFARGLRNSVGLTWHPDTKELWGTDNGRDWLGDNLPPDEVNVISGKKDYGWPYCYGHNIPDPEFENAKRCENTISPVIEIQAHSAPLGLEFYNGKMFPPEYKNNLFVAYHGSWNRSELTGYKVVRFKIEDGKTEEEDFVWGWLSGSEKTGRPVGVLVGNEGELFISDDYGGKVYKVTVNTKSGSPSK